ncbi:hypothetical protein LCGC14_0924450 [marine sediment metagenome]|uniref:Uncharacterized protein n=1 Tax=marine sediment metagenome TaxID=412755 RepID=A0A0F9RWF7_9ZZZZ
MTKKLERLTPQHFGLIRYLAEEAAKKVAAGVDVHQIAYSTTFDAIVNFYEFLQKENT